MPFHCRTNNSPKLQQADTIALRYDSVLKFPSRVMLDFLADAVDDEIEYEASGLEPIKLLSGTAGYQAGLFNESHPFRSE